MENIKHVDLRQFAANAGEFDVRHFNDGGEMVIDTGTGSGRGAYANGGNALYGDIEDMGDRGTFLVLDETDQDGDHLAIDVVDGRHYFLSVLKGQ